MTYLIGKRFQDSSIVDKKASVHILLHVSTSTYIYGEPVGPLQHRHSKTVSKFSESKLDTSNYILQYCKSMLIMFKDAHAYITKFVSYRFVLVCMNIIL